jgi:hypothetical protein
MARGLDSGELFFQSFRHSQGSVRAQLQEFHYMKLQFGITTELTPDETTRQRLISFIDGVHAGPARHHIHLGDGGDRDSAVEVFDALDELGAFYRGTEGSVARSRSLPSTISDLAHTLIEQEIRLLGSGEDWLEESEFSKAGRSERQKTRVESGRASFLLFHGRDGHTTGFVEFDRMYDDVWKVAQGSADHAPVLERLNRVVNEAELKYLGFLCLGAP